MLSGQRERILLLCPSLAPQAIQKLPLQTFVLYMLQRTFYYNTGIQNLAFCQGNFSFIIHPLVYGCPNYSVIVFIAKKVSKGRSLGTQMECESDFFFFLALGFLTFKNIFHLTPWCWCLPAMHSLSQIYPLGIPRGHL